MAKLTWNDLFVTGALINFTAHVWRAQIRITAKDLGLDDVPEVKQALSLGSHRLAPQERLKVFVNLENRARRAIEQYSLNPGVLDGVRYVPDVQIRNLTALLEEVRAEFDGEVEKILVEYEAIKDAMLPVTKVALESASQTPEAALTAYNRVLKEYPDPKTIRRKFGLEWKFFALQAPVSEAAAEAAKDGGDQVREAVKGMVEQLREELNTRVANLITLAKRGESLPTKSVNSALELLDRVDSMNVLGDSVLANQVKTLRTLLSSDDEDEDVGVVLAELTEVKATLEQDVEAAVAEAEDKLIGLGRRKIR